MKCVRTAGDGKASTRTALMIDNKKITMSALLAAVAVVLGYIETFFPVPIPIPGIKWGLGNIVILTGVYILDKRYVFFIMITKVFVTALFFSSVSALIYSLSGGILSICAMLVLKKSGFNIVSVSIGGGIFHNAGQLLAASAVMKSTAVFSYFPFLFVFGTVTAAVVGIAGKIVVEKIKNIV